MRVLILESDIKSAENLRDVFPDYFELLITDEEADASDLASLYPYDAILISEVITDNDALTSLSNIQKHQGNTPIIVLGNSDGGIPSWEYLNAGADDFVRKPVSFEDIFARINSVIRRLGVSNEFTKNGFQFNSLLKTASVDGVVFDVTPSEGCLLEAFAGGVKGQVFSRSQLMDKLPNDHYWSDRQIDSIIKKIRGKMVKATGGHHYIKTHYGHGYSITEEPIESGKLKLSFDGSKKDSPNKGVTSAPNLKAV